MANGDFTTELCANRVQNPYMPTAPLETVHESNALKVALLQIAL